MLRCRILLLIPCQFGLPLLVIWRVRPRPWPTWHKLSEAFLWCWQYPNEAAALVPLGGGLHHGHVCPDSGLIPGILWTITTTLPQLRGDTEHRTWRTARRWQGRRQGWTGGSGSPPSSQLSPSPATFGEIAQLHSACQTKEHLDSW